MVNIAIAGGSGNIGQEIIDALVATNKHEILILTRKSIHRDDAVGKGTVRWAQTDYQDIGALADILKGNDTVLSFIDASSDNGNQKRLIDAAVQAGVRRFAPSEWSSSSIDYMSFYAAKGRAREYLKEINKDKKILEYTLFQPGLLTNYLAFPHNTTRHVAIIETSFDFNNCRSLVVSGREDSPITFTTIQDIANVVAKAVEYEGEWPVIGGIKGSELTFAQAIALGEKVRGKPFQVEKLKAEDLESGNMTSSWLPETRHHSIKEDDFATMAKGMMCQLMLAFSSGGWNVSDEWNRLLPQYQFTRAEDFLHQIWKDRP